MFRIDRIIVRNWRQFENLDVSLTDAIDKNALTQVCLIGSNGTGKSSLLRAIFSTLSMVSSGCQPVVHHMRRMLALRIRTNGACRIYLIRLYEDGDELNPASRLYSILSDEIDNNAAWNEWIAGRIDGMPSTVALQYRFSESEELKLCDEISFKDGRDLLIHASLDESENQSAVPQLDDAIRLFQKFPAVHEVSNRTLSNFWKHLTFQIRKRDNDLSDFLNAEANQVKPVGQVKSEFDCVYPDILPQIAQLWDSILGRAGLELDMQNIKKPVQLTDRLEAHVRVRGSSIQIPYPLMSTGMRNFIFRAGHLFTLFFRRQVQNALVIVDEPENSLYPDFLFDLLSIYLRVTPGAQLLFATHNPIFAAQFRPEERVILEFTGGPTVRAMRGVSPEGDDPNDLLDRDFHVRSLYGKEGLKQWERFKELRRLVRDESDPERKLEFMDEYMKIGQAYNFSPADALS